uniref:Uncharacterized protein n=1 Tax=Morchella importuna TaxID=1174673 RepID=A0A650AFH3_9PEZI|nr:hypothetical protein [Morchella importuna]QGN66641.1 hypothetical protein [Morchella importuna]
MSNVKILRGIMDNQQETKDRCRVGSSETTCGTSFPFFPACKASPGSSILTHIVFHYAPLPTYYPCSTVGEGGKGEGVGGCSPLSRRERGPLVGKNWSRDEDIVHSK